jgi:hypothetical protein
LRASPNRLIVSVLAVSTIFGLGQILNREPPIPEPEVADRPVQLDQDGYAGSQTCQACHPSQYRTWYRSYHRTMTQVATPETAVADFDNVTVEAVHGRPMLLQRTGRQLWAQFDDPDSSNQPELRRPIKRPVVMITGSHHQQVYWYATGKRRLLGQLPGAYLIAEQRWIPRRHAVLHPPGEPPLSETGHWNSICIACHATHGKPQFDTPFGSRPVDDQVVETTAAEFGIACEACHGPGERHARTNGNPLRRYGFHLSGTPDDTIMQPLRMNVRRSSEVCGQCHGVWEFYDRAGERRANSGGLPFRPGDALRETRFVAQPASNADSPAMKTLLADDPRFITDSFWSDGMVRVTGREYNGLIESPCFTNATEDKRTLSCMSCHAMHASPGDPRPLDQWADDQLAPGMAGNDACVQCHPAVGAQLTAHTKHGADSAGSTCYNCHMPYTTYGLLKTIRSHTVSNPSAAESQQTGRPNACNLCHLDKTLKWTAENLGRWYGTPEVSLTDDEQTVAASLLWVLRGDAGQRAITAQAMAWSPAQQVSGTEWMAPYLAQLLDDPYDAIRFIASRSLRTLPGFGGFDYDFIQPPAVRRAAQLRAMATWDRGRNQPRTERPDLLMKANGVDVETTLRLLKERNTRRMLLRE